MSENKKEQIVALLKGIETGDPKSVTVVNEAKYIQHNPQTHEGSEGLAALFKRLSKTSPRVNIVRVFEDGDFVFAHTEYDFAKRNIGFEVFRFEDGQAVEHWDNIQRRLGPNQSGHSMVDGIVEVSNIDETETNRNLLMSFVEDVLISGRHEKLSDYVNLKEYREHNPHMTDELETTLVALTNTESSRTVQYKKCHRILAEGNFALTVCEGDLNGEGASFYDLYRVDSGKIVEHWDTTEVIPPRSEWKNENGKF